MRVSGGVISTLLLLLHGTTSAYGEVLVSCGASEGRAYVIEGGLVGPGQGGWINDQISGGTLEVVKQGADYDVHYYDATRRSYSARQDDGATVVPLRETPAELVILVAYPNRPLGGTTEVYQFRPLDREVVWMQMKYGGAVNKTAVFYARCDRAPE